MDNNWESQAVIKKDVLILPSEDDKPKTAEWIRSNTSLYTSTFNITEMVVKCSHCGQEMRISRASVYCPACGRLMVMAK